MTDLTQMLPTALDNLYRCSPVGEIPDGLSHGTVVFWSGLPNGKFLSAIAKLLVWKGKVFYRKQGVLLNRITPLGIQGVKANVDRGKSWFSDGEAIILDYAKTSFVAQKIRDEIREISPGVYLGQAYWGKTRVLCFVLEF